MKPEVGQARLAATVGNGEMILVVLAGPFEGNIAWKCVVVHSTVWYGRHFKIGSVTCYGEEWLMKTTVTI